MPGILHVNNGLSIWMVGMLRRELNKWQLSCLPNACQAGATIDSIPDLAAI